MELLWVSLRTRSEICPFQTLHVLEEKCFLKHSSLKGGLVLFILYCPISDQGICGWIGGLAPWLRPVRAYSRQTQNPPSRGSLFVCGFAAYCAKLLFMGSSSRKSARSFSLFNLGVSCSTEPFLDSRKAFKEANLVVLTHLVILYSGKMNGDLAIKSF